MCKARLLKKLRQSQNMNKSGRETSQTIPNFQNHKKLSSKEFLNGYDLIWKEGPQTTYQNPDQWRKIEDTS